MHAAGRDAHRPTEQIRNRPSFNVNNAQNICHSEAVPLHRHNIINENPKMIGTNNKDNRGGRRRSFNGGIAAKHTDIPTTSTKRSYSIRKRCEVYFLNVAVHNVNTGHRTHQYQYVHRRERVGTRLGLYT